MSMFSVGPIMIILLAGLQGVPKELYESAEIDGAGHWAKFRNVTLPMLSPVLFFVIIISVVSSFQNFTEIRVMTEGGPGESSNVLIWYSVGERVHIPAIGRRRRRRLDHVCHPHGTDGYPVPCWAGAGFTTRLTPDDDEKAQGKCLPGAGRFRDAALLVILLTFALLIAARHRLSSCLSSSWSRPR